MAKEGTFSSILDKAPSEIERPKPLPAGEYVCIVDGQPKFDKSAKKQTDYVEFSLKPMEAMESVDEDALASALIRGNGEKKLLSDSRIRATYYLTEDSLYRLKDFLKHCGLDLDEDDKSIRQWIEETPGCNIIATIKHTSSEDGESMYANLAKTAPVEA
jgi:hypothetical protein